MPAKLRYTLLTFIALVTVVSTPAQLVKPQSIKIKGTSEYAVAEIEAATGLTPGKAYSSDDLNVRSKKLLASGVFEKVAYEFDGVDLLFLLTLSSQLYPMTFDNLPLDPGPDLDARLRQKVPLFHGLVPTEGSTLDDLCRALDQALAEQGIQAQIAAAPSGDASAHRVNAMRFTIPAPAVKIGSLQFEGLSPEMSARVTEAAQHSGGAYETGKTEASLQRRFLSIYMNEGYAAATIEVRRTGNPTNTSDAIRVPFELRIQQGQTYKLGIVSMAPGIPVDPLALQKMTAPRARFLPESRYLGALAAGVDQQLKSKGYLDCDVTLQAKIDEAAGVANYVVAADLGPVYHVAFVKFQDVSPDLRSLLMRNWQMLPGDPFNKSYPGTFLLEAQRSDGALREALAGMKVTYDVHADPETHEVNIVIRLAKQ